MIKGRVHSIQSLATVDGPGVRFAVFMQGCPLRCKCCHNPDTWVFEGGKEYSAEEIVEQAARFKEYFGDKGGITLSGGEPLMQAEFCAEVFELCHKKGINTCLDTAGILLDDKVKRLLSVTDRVLLDIKYTDEILYQENVGCSIDGPMAFLDCLKELGIATTLRQVIIPTVNDGDENALALKKIVESHPNIDKVELLPFRKICQVKYDSMGIPFPFGELDEGAADLIKRLEAIIAD